MVGGPELKEAGCGDNGITKNSIRNRRMDL